MFTMTICKDIRVEEIPDDLRKRLKNISSGTDGTRCRAGRRFHQKFFNEEEITIDEIKTCIRKSTINNTMVPVTCGTSYRNKGVQKLLDAIVDYMPAPMDVPSIKGA